MNKIIIIIIIIVSILLTLFLSFLIWINFTQGKNIGKFEKAGTANNEYTNNDCAVLLHNGDVLLVKKSSSDYYFIKKAENKSNLAEVYNPKTKKFRRITSTISPHSHTNLTLLKSGKVLLLGAIGGIPNNKQDLIDKNLIYSDYAELYNPKAEKFELTGKMQYPRISPAAVLLKDGRVLILGGKYELKKGDKAYRYISQAEIYDPKTGKFNITGSLNQANRFKIGAILLKNGKVLIFGNKTTEIYDPISEKFSYGPSLNIRRPIIYTTMLNDGRVIFYGEEEPYINDRDKWGTPPEIYNPETNKFTFMPKMKIKRRHYTAITLKNGQVLFAGGDEAIFGFGGSSSKLIKQAEIYDPEKNEFILDADMLYPRSGHMAFSLPSNKVLIVGGINRKALKQAEIYSLND